MTQWCTIIGLFYSAYIEIEESREDPADDLYELIKMQLENALGEKNRSVTEYKHSYDSHRKVFRFDMNPSGKAFPLFVK